MGPGACMTRFESIDWYDTPRYYDIVFDAGTAAKWFTNDRNRFS